MVFKLRFQFNFVCVLVLLFIFETHASITRTRTMGDVGMIIHDNANFWIFPARIVEYPNQILIETGGKAELISYLPSNYGFDQWAGGVVQISPISSNTIGIFLSEASTNQPFEIYNNTSQINRHKFSLFYGHQKGTNAFGAHLGFASVNQSSSYDSGIKNENSILQTNFELGISATSLDIVAGYQLTASQSSGNKVSGHRLNSILRFFRPLQSNLTLVPLIKLEVGQEGIDNNNSTDVNAYFWRTLLGIGLNYQIGENDLIAFGINFSRNGQSRETGKQSKMKSVTWDAPFIFGGLESEFIHWGKIRFGFQKALRFVNNSAESSGTTFSKDSYSEAPFAFTAGIGFQFKRITIDLSWDSNFLQRGPYFASGSKGDIFNLISIAYNFQK